MSKLPLALAAFALSACDLVEFDPAYDAWLWVPGATFRPGPAPEPAGGPDVVGVQALRASLQLGATRERLRGQLGIGARAFAIGLAGDRGLWLVPASAPTAEVPGLPSFDLRAHVSPRAPAGPVELVAVAFDDAGRPGRALALPLTLEPEAPPAGQLVVALHWDSAADLDLHVVDPLGGEAWSGEPNTWKPPAPGEPAAPPDAWRAGGILTRDANAGCRRDGTPSEHVVWSLPPPAGRYLVRVVTRSLCGLHSTGWRVAAYGPGGTSVIGATRGFSLPQDAARPSGRGAGVVALEFALSAPP